MKVLVTGGAGYIGSVVAAELLRAGHTAVVYDNLAKGHAGAVPRGAELVVGDVADRASLDHLLADYGFDAVMHFAASIEVSESMRAPEKFFRNNTAGTLTLLEAMLAAGVGRIVFSSTAALYGDPERTPIEEDDRLQPTNPYGESKLLAERMLAWFHRVHRLRYASLRYFNAAGATPERGEAHDPESHLIPVVLGVALGQRASVSVFGNDYPTRDGTCIRDYIHVADLADAHVRALEALAEREQLIYNVGNGAGFSVREVIEAARTITGHSIPTVEAPRRAGDPAVLVASSERVRRELGWQPRYAELAAIIGSAWEWHRQHPHGFAAAAA